MGTVTRWGNSLAVRLPKAIAEQVSLEEGSSVTITIEEGRIVLTPVARVYNLDELLAEITPENLHSEIQTGEAVGAELW